MKNLRIYISISLVLLAINSNACFVTRTLPIANMIYRLYEDVSPFYRYEQDVYGRMYAGNDTFEKRKENIDLWRKQTGCHLSDNQIEMYVYKYTAQQLKYNEKTVTKYFGKDGYKLLLMAKKIEDIRNQMNDPWYYPTKDDPLVKNLAELAKECSAYKGKLLNRYALQTIRAYVSMRRYHDAVAYWEKVKSKLQSDVIKEKAERHVAAAYLRSGKTDIAVKTYARMGDIASLRMCGVKNGEEWNIIYEECPDSPFFPVEFQNFLCHIDNDMYYREAYQPLSYGYPVEFSEEDSLMMQTVGNLARRALKEGKVRDKAMWYYSLACILDAEHKAEEALQYATKGQQYCAQGTFLAKSMRVLCIYLEAETSKYDDKYKDHLYSELKWLDDNGKRNMPKDLKVELVHRANTEKTNDDYVPDMNYDNKYYWSDIIKRICSATLAKRLHAEGKTADALLLADFGDFWLLRNATGKAHSTNEWGIYDFTDYTNTMACMADTCSANDIVAAYMQITNPKKNLCRLIKSNSLDSKEYWSDIIGTHYIKEHKYADAAKWLANCGKSFQATLSTWEYLDRDPFCMKIGFNDCCRHHLASRLNYKLNFTRTMAKLGYDMYHAKTSDERGVAMVKYGVGLRNQSDWAWALSRNSDSYDDHDNKIDFTGSRKYIDRGLSIIKNKELRAKYLHALARNRDVMNYCPNTNMAKYLRAHCDTWRNYKRS